MLQLSLHLLPSGLVPTAVWGAAWYQWLLVCRTGFYPEVLGGNLLLFLRGCAAKVKNRMLGCPLPKTHTQTWEIKQQKHLLKIPGARFLKSLLLC